MRTLEKIDNYVSRKNRENSNNYYWYDNKEFFIRDKFENCTTCYNSFSDFEELEEWLDEQLKEEDEELSYKDDWLLGLKLLYKIVVKLTVQEIGFDHVYVSSDSKVSYKEIKNNFTLLNGQPITYKNFLKWKFEQNKKYEDDYERLCGGK